MAQQLYILNENNEPQPVTWGKYDQWEEKLPKDARCALGKRIKTDVIGGVTVVTVFLMCPIGYYGRKPQLWYTLAAGDGIFDERRYSSHRAALQGHASACREYRPALA